MVISQAWHSYGSAFFLELGELHNEEIFKRISQKGEATICVYWDWRIHNGSEILCGSCNSGKKIEDTIQFFVGQTISSIDIYGKVPELQIIFSNNLTLETMCMKAGDPEWNIRLQDNTWLAWETEATIKKDNEEHEYYLDGQNALIKTIEKATKKWETPSGKMKNKICNACSFFVRLDGSYDLLEYGTCLKVKSNLFGKIISDENSCSLFVKKKYVE